MKTKAFIVVQPSFSHYREPFVRALLKNEDIHIQLAGRYPGGSTSADKSDGIQTASSSTTQNAIRLERRPLYSHFFWDECLVSNVIRSDADIFVLEGNIFSFSTWVAAFVLKIRKKKVAFWGHGWRKPESGIKLWLRKGFYKLPDAHFVYGDWSVDYAQQQGFQRSRWHAIYNSIYSSLQLESMGQIDETSFSQELSTLKLIFSGRLSKRHEVDKAIRAVGALRSSHGIDARLTVVGDGSELESLKTLAGSLGSAVQFLGPQHDFHILESLYQKADFAISPGASGLNIIQSLSFGVPVIAAQGHEDSGPELEALHDGEAGLFFQNEDFSDLVNVLKQAHQLPGNIRQSMGMTGREIAYQRYVAEAHAGAMVAAILKSI